MKRLLRAALTVAIVVAKSTTIFAQTQGRVNVQEFVSLMPETRSMQSDLETIQKDFQSNLETMQSELSSKLADYQKNQSTMSESIRSLKEKDMQDLNMRMQQFEQNAMQEIQRKQNELLQPILTKARDAIDAVAKEGGYLVVYDESGGALAYFDATKVIDITPAVKKQLGI